MKRPSVNSYTVKPVYKSHSSEPENVALKMSSCPWYKHIYS